MDERLKRDVKMFLIVLIACLIFVGAVETFTGILSETRERNLTNQKNIESILDILKNETLANKIVINERIPQLKFLI